MVVVLVDVAEVGGGGAGGVVVVLLNLWLNGIVVVWFAGAACPAELALETREGKLEVAVVVDELSARAKLKNTASKFRNSEVLIFGVDVAAGISLAFAGTVPVEVGPISAGVDVDDVEVDKIAVELACPVEETFPK